MNWLFPTLAALMVVHIAAIVSGRSTASLVHRIAFTSGIVGLVSIPTLILAAFKSICIAGGCNDRLSGTDILGAVVVAAAIASLLSTAVIYIRRTRA